VPKSNKEEKSITRQVNLAVTSPPATIEYLHWSEQPIEFSRDDHPITVPRPGNTPLVLKAQIGTYDVDRVFMDARSGINLIYAKTLRAMHISLEFLKPTDCSFHGIVPGSARGARHSVWWSVVADGHPLANCGGEGRVQAAAACSKRCCGEEFASSTNIEVLLLGRGGEGMKSGTSCPTDLELWVKGVLMTPILRL
jgi:hypothetical protein